MTNLEFVETAKRIENTLNTRYQLGGWGQQDGNTYLFDCVCLIKSILWGFNFQKGGHGGATYCSNGVPDVNCNVMFETYCKEKSTDFNNIEVGEFVFMDGHIGIYIGDRKVVEATAGWENKVLISEIGTNGERTRNGHRIYRWTHHGKSVFLNYVEHKPITLNFKKGDKVVVNGYLHAKACEGATRGVYLTNYVDTISLTCDRYGTVYPYNIGENYLGWVRETAIKLYQEPKKEELKKEEEKQQEAPAIESKEENNTNNQVDIKNPQNEANDDKIEHDSNNNEKEKEYRLNVIIELLKKIWQFIIVIFKKD